MLLALGILLLCTWPKPLCFKQEEQYYFSKLSQVSKAHRLQHFGLKFGDRSHRPLGPDFKLLDLIVQLGKFHIRVPCPPYLTLISLLLQLSAPARLPVRQQDL